MSNRFAIKKLEILIEVIENKTGEWATLVPNSDLRKTLLEQLHRVKNGIGTDCIDITDMEWNDDPR